MRIRIKKNVSEYVLFRVVSVELHVVALFNKVVPLTYKAPLANVKFPESSNSNLPCETPGASTDIIP